MKPDASRVFVRRYRLVILAAGLAWNGLLVARSAGDGGSFVSGISVFTIMMLPVLALVALAGFIRSAPVLIVAALLHALLVGKAFLDVERSTSSTAAVLLGLAPLISLGVVVPLAALVGWIVRQRAPGRAQTRRADRLDM